MKREEITRMRAYQIADASVKAFNENQDIDTESFVKGAEWSDEHPNWISVEDELPPKESKYDDNSIVVLATDGNGVYKGLYRSGEYLSGWFTYDLWELDNITHWMPLPNPPKKGE